MSGASGSTYAAAWSLDASVAYLNHGSFGPAPLVVRHEQRHWLDLLQAQPMDFLVRHWHARLAQVCEKLGTFVGAPAGDLIPVDNATAGMNVVAESFALVPGDEVLLADHEYGAVRRIWQRACARAGAALVEATAPVPVSDAGQIASALFARVTPRTRLLVVSHVTSPTALIFPVEELCREARRRELAVCVDGPHALAMLPVDLAALDCDYYTASCHKWLAAPFGAGFLYVHPRRQAHVQPPVMSWGRPAPGAAASWRDEFTWSGTRDPSAFLSVPRAIEFLEEVGLETFRQHGHALASYARARIGELTGLEPLSPDSRDFFGTMVAFPLPPGETDGLHQRLRQDYGLEVPVYDWQGRRLIRVSCHLYNSADQIDRLAAALRELL